MRKKAAISLSMNVLVIIIISIVILVGSVAFLYKLIGGAESIKSDLDERTNQQLKQLLIDQGKRTAVYPYKVTISHANNAVFGIGVLNVDEDSTADFSLEITLTKVLDIQSVDITTTLNLEDLQLNALLYTAESFKVLQNEHKNIPVLVSIPTNYPSGTYIFNAIITVSSTDSSEQEQYGPSQKFYVEVQ
ncbi:hypothetical protein COV17_03105 [Candidatus Woesearchaeota archaeon CG10_big_fil_rev_8_21_14_0_10_36_11]|nr:MAG: hypothetical protein COV17_03105 [Candidatus Woesearchaeota archaeon CG10_big_fil_rev_8_21_14_0_10_36_11]